MTISSGQMGAQDTSADESRQHARVVATRVRKKRHESSAY
jgi:hypothetical protein